jgi:hypothetical protein
MSGKFVIHAYRATIEEKLTEPIFQAKLAELLKPNIPTRLVVELFRGLLYESDPTIPKED